MTNYYIRAGYKTLGPYESIVKARAAAIRALKNGRCTYATTSGDMSVAVSTNKEFSGSAGFHPQVLWRNGTFLWNTWDFGNLSDMPIVNADGTLRRRS